MNERRCSVCDKTSGEVRLCRDYSPAGNLSDRDIWCNAHAPADKAFVVPCVVDASDGRVLSLFAEPKGTQLHFDRWWALPEADPAGWTRPMRDEVP